jgi:serine/threonine-protein kinase
VTPTTEVPEVLRQALEGRYRIERLLGEGGMATVYLAEDLRHSRRVAVKVLRAELTQTIGVERFHREIGIAARLNHPHILPLLDSGTLDFGPGRFPSAFYVMPFVPGESLRDRLLREGKLPVPVALRLAREVADALDHAHRQGVIHRDIKPENILLSEQHAVVADFGIARALDQAQSGNITQTGQTLGTPAYMSPEQAVGEAEIDGRADLYALGCTLFEMLTGQPPWSGGSGPAVLARRLTEPPPRVRTLEPGVPVLVEKALLKTLSREPDERFKTPAEFAAAIELGTGTGPVTIQPKRWGLRALVVTLVLAAAAVALIKLVPLGHADAITSIAIAGSSGGSQDTSTAFLSEGIQEEVANLLRRLPQLRITAPSVVAQLQRQQPTLSYIALGQQLKVAGVLTWDLTSSRDSIIVKAELLKVPSGDLLWNLRTGRPKAEVASLQGAIAEQVASSLRLQLTGSERASMARTPTASGEAYAFYLRGRQFSLRGVPLGGAEAHLLMDSAAYYGRKAIAVDPGFAQAHGLLGTYYFVAAFRGWAPFAEYMDSSEVSAQRTLATDSTLPDPYINRISKAIYLDDDWNTAQAIADRALHLAGHDAQVLQFIGIVTGEVQGRLDSAISLLRRAVELEPSIPDLNTLGDLYMRAGRYDSAVVALRRAVDFDPTVPGPRRRLIFSLEKLKRYPEAIAARREGGDSVWTSKYEKAFQSGGGPAYETVRREDLMHQLQPLLAPLNRPYKVPDDTVPQLREEKVAAIYAQLGQWTDAMDWVLKEYEHRPRRLRLYVTNPAFAGLVNDPRFLSLVKKEGLEALLRH